MNANSCPSCGMEKNTWPNQRGVQEGGKTYCCQGCADGTGCTCSPRTASSKTQSTAGGSSQGSSSRQGESVGGPRKGRT